MQHMLRIRFGPPTLHDKEVMRFRALIVILVCCITAPAFSNAQARSLVATAIPQVNLTGVRGQQFVLGSVVLGKPRTFSMFNIQAAGTITPDPELNGAEFQLQFLICDQPDCTGDIKTVTRILPDADAATATQVIATRSFGVSTHNVQPVALTDFRPRNPGGVLYLAAALRLLHGSGPTAFTAKLSLLRIDVMP